MTFVDTHAHLEAIDDLDGVLDRAKNVGVGKIVTVGTSVETSKKVVKIAEEFSTDDLKIYATCGIHPKDGKDDIQIYRFHYIDILKSVITSSKKVVGIGETGLDYRVTSDNLQLTTDKEKEFQRELFEAQIKLAKELRLPLIIHCRNAWDDIFDFLSNVNGPADAKTLAGKQLSNVTGVFHSWTGNWDAAKKALDLGFYISFSGIVTFKNAKEIQEVAKKMPVDKMLVETDSPYLSPEPWRGKINEPKNVKIVANFLARLRNLPFDKIAEATSQNAKGLFGI